MATVPSFYDRNTVGNLYKPDLAAATSYGYSLRNQMSPATRDDPRILLWLIDVQIDFVFDGWNLPVPGAVEDTARTIEWLYRNLERVTSIAGTLDTHFAFQIFGPLWWIDENGNNPDPYTAISSADIDAGKWRPVQMAKWSIDYVKKLENTNKKALMIWPFHCMEGSIGRSLVPALTEAIHVHSVARYAQPTLLTKGTIVQSEYYSAIEPEVHVPNNPMGGLNTAFLDMVAKYDLIYVAGQAKSHCVLETMKSTVRHFGQSNPAVVQKLRFLDDCTSSIPGFEDVTDQEFADFARQGLQIVTSNDPIS